MPFISAYETAPQETLTPSPLQLRTEAWEAFRAQPLLPDPSQLEHGHVSALLAHLTDGDWGAVVISLIAKPMSKKKVMEI